MRVAVRLFGAVREAVGEKELSVELPDGASLAELRRLLARRHAVFDAYGDRLAVSVNLEVVPLGHRSARRRRGGLPAAGLGRRRPLLDLGAAASTWPTRWRG